MSRRAPAAPAVISVTLAFGIGARSAVVADALALGRGVIFALALALAVTVALGACASGTPTLGPDQTIVGTSELAAVRAQAAKVPPLTAQIASQDVQLATLRAELSQSRQRLGLDDFAPKHLQAVDAPFTLPSARAVVTVDARPHNQKLKKLLARSQRGLVVAFWATWCVPCVKAEELRQVRALSDALRAQGVAFISLAVDDLDDVRGHRRADEWVYPLWQRDGGHLDMLPRAFIRTGVELPLFAIVSKDGTLRWVREGALSPEISDEILTAAMRMPLK